MCWSSDDLPRLLGLIVASFGTAGRLSRHLEIYPPVSEAGWSTKGQREFFVIGLPEAVVWMAGRHRLKVSGPSCATSN